MARDWFETSTLSTAVIVPARNEEAGLLLALESLAAQTAVPDLVIVVVNNSCDETEAVAREFARSNALPVHVMAMKRNRWKKAGALNAGFRQLLKMTGHAKISDAARYLLVMDADTELGPEFIARALSVLRSDQRLGGVSAACLGRKGTAGNLWQRWLLGMQRIEYGRYSALRVRRNVHTMSGAGSFYRAAALQDIIDLRGDVFREDKQNIVEDYETTLTLKELGWKVTANQWCTAQTDLMPTVRSLIAQRERWVRGTVDTLRRRGWTTHTWQSIATLLLGFSGYAYTAVWLAQSANSIVRHGGHADPRYLLLLVFWVIYQVITSWHLGWKAVLTEALILPETAFGLLRVWWLTTAVVRSYLAHASAWA